MILLGTFFISSITYAADFIPSSVGDGDNYYFADFKALESMFDDAFEISSNHDSSTKTYTVEKGDNLYRIALNHHISLAELKSWNHLTSEVIHPGDELIVSGEDVPTQDKQVAKESASPNTSRESVKPKATESKTVAEGSSAKEITVRATAYTAYCEGCSGITAYGLDLRSNPNQKVIAVDPNIIALGTKVWVEGYGEAIAGDTGGAIKGNKIDVFIPTYDGAIDWGVRTVKVKILE